MSRRPQKLGRLPSLAPSTEAETHALPSTDTTSEDHAPERGAADAAEHHNRRPRRRQRGDDSRRTRSDGRVLLQTYHFPAGIDQLRELARQEKTFVTDMVTEAINDLLKKYHRPPLA